MPHNCVDESSKMQFLYVTYRYDEVRITLGEHDRTKLDPNEKELIVKPKNVIMHPGYDRSTGNDDIALIRLDSPLQWDTAKKLRPVCLATSPPPVESTSIVMGWGDTMHGKYSRYHGRNPMQLS